MPVLGLPGPTSPASGPQKPGAEVRGRDTLFTEALTRDAEEPGGASCLGPGSPPSRGSWEAETTPPPARGKAHPAAQAAGWGPGAALTPPAHQARSLRVPRAGAAEQAAPWEGPGRWGEEAGAPGPVGGPWRRVPQGAWQAERVTRWPGAAARTAPG